MGLPPRQQVILDQIEKALQATDPALRSMFAAFHRATKAHPLPRTEVISGRSLRLLLVICVVVASTAGVLVLGIRSTSNDCPGLSSDQVVASAAVRYAACSKSTDVWSRGAR
jgi:Protein of unknown function (DUF3040)